MNIRCKSFYDALNRPTRRNNDTFGYNDRSEVTSASIAGVPAAYNYDEIGNSLSYAANNLNQYTNFVYDADGNMLCDGVRTYTYDAANRLKTVATNGVLLLTNFYDAKSRRVRKATPEATTTYFYDDWNLIEERIGYASGTSSTNRYYWGKDLSGSLQGAGGVSGLLYMTIDNAVYVPFYDNNGNITHYIGSDGTVVASYTYDAFGGTLAATGTLAHIFRHRFSTKYRDDETGLYYYGYRFYHPALMRWLNRDPIVEDGGANLYAFCENASVYLYDLLGNIAYYADFARHQLAAEDQNMKKHTDMSEVLNLVKVAKDYWGSLEIGVMETENVSMMSGIGGGKPYRTLLVKMLNDKDSHPQFYGHGAPDRIIMAQTGERQNPDLVLEIGTLEKAMNVIPREQLSKIKWQDFSFYSCNVAMGISSGLNFCETFSKLTGKPVSGNIGFNTLGIETWLFCKNGSICRDAKIVAEFEQLANKLQNSNVSYGGSTFSADDFKKQWKALTDKYRARGKLDKAYWDVYQVEFENRVTIGR